ncbi:hypothetical protein D3C86_1854640 [compost metagenome]
MGLQALDEIRVGQDHLAIGFHVRESRRHVGANLLSGATRAIEDQGLLPQRANVRQQCFVALVHDVQIGKPKLVEFSH